MTLTVKELSNACFQMIGDDWQRCLEQSDANPLFSSWPWLFSWWERWSQILGLELLLLGAYNECGELVGIGPFYRRDLITPLGLRISRVHMLGNAWHVAPTVRTEYSGLILKNQHREEARSALLSHLSSLDWDELILCDMLGDELSQFSKVIDQSGPASRAERVYRVQDEGVRVDTCGRFDDWLNGLGKNTRLKVYNRRTYLDKKGSLDIEPVDANEQFFNQLNGFHGSRWGKPAFDREAVLFHLQLAERMSQYGMTTACSILKFNGDCISVLYDIVAQGWRFNLQSGYREEFDPKVSLGSLHFGFAIEQAYSDPGIDHYDLLAGSGKNSFYKQHFNGQTTVFNTLQLVRTPWLKMAYRKQLALPDSWRRLINRAFRL